MKSNWHAAEAYWRDFFVNAQGRSQPGSGNQPGAPGDERYLERVQFSVNERVLLESKYTAGKSIAIQEAWLDKIRHEAALLGRVPMLGIIIGEQKWLAVPDWIIVQPEHS